MTRKQKEELLGVFSEAFHEVVPPLLDDLQEKITSELGERIDQLDRKIFNVTDPHSLRLDDHERRIEAIEKELKTT